MMTWAVVFEDGFAITQIHATNEHDAVKFAEEMAKTLGFESTPIQATYKE